ncbi:hypothetical protein L1887_35040 [Cichorium endivia]|nr:hypothetical protein L1887_35040 [Cichorium endivia]
MCVAGRDQRWQLRRQDRGRCGGSVGRGTIAVVDEIVVMEEVRWQQHLVTLMIECGDNDSSDGGRANNLPLFFLLSFRKTSPQPN